MFYRTSSAHPPLCPRPSSPLPHGYRGPGMWGWVRGCLQGRAVRGMDTEGPLDFVLSAVLEQPPSPGTAAWTLSGVSIVVHLSHTLGSHTKLTLPSGFQQQLSKVLIQKQMESSSKRANASVYSFMCLFIHQPTHPLVSCLSIIFHSVNLRINLLVNESGC